MGNRRGVAEVRSTRFEQRTVDPQMEQRPADPQALRARDFTRADRFVEEFQEMDRDGTVPNFMFMSLGENHTSGTTPGAYTPKAQVASNDVAVGKIVEAITKSRVWSEFAIFIIEDDAQNGPDHVDSHRTAGLVISPYVKRSVVDSTMYSTVSMLRTVELLLGLPPMTQHDAAAPPMVNSFMAKPDLSGFTALPAQDRSDDEESRRRATARRSRPGWTSATTIASTRTRSTASSGTASRAPTCRIRRPCAAPCPRRTVCSGSPAIVTVTGIATR